MKIIPRTPKRSYRRKGKTGVCFRKTKAVYYKSTMKKKDLVKVTCVNLNLFDSYEELKNFCISLRLKDLKICVIGDCKWPPLPFPIFRYYLIYNKDNFLGEELMGMYDNNAYLTFFLDYPEDFDKVKAIIHRTIYLGAPVEILLVCINKAVMPYKTVYKEKISDYNFVLEQDAPLFLPLIRNRKTYVRWVVKKI